MYYFHLRPDSCWYNRSDTWVVQNPAHHEHLMPWSIDAACQGPRACWELLFKWWIVLCYRRHSLASKTCRIPWHPPSYWGLPDSTPHPNPSRIPPAPLNLLCHNGPSSKAAYILAWVCFLALSGSMNDGNSTFNCGMYWCPKAKEGHGTWCCLLLKAQYKGQ